MCSGVQPWNGGKPPAKQEGSWRSDAAIGNGVCVLAISLEEENNIRTRCRGAEPWANGSGRSRRIGSISRIVVRSSVPGNR